MQEKNDKYIRSPVRSLCRKFTKNVFQKINIIDFLAKHNEHYENWEWRMAKYILPGMTLWSLINCSTATMTLWSLIDYSTATMLQNSLVYVCSKQ